jgi:hypothetical protein
MQSKIIYFFGVLLFIVGCRDISHRKEDEILINKFPKEELLQATELEIPPIVLKPSNMCIVDSFLIISQSRGDSIFSIFSLPNCHFLTSFGNEGRGPNEFNMAFENVTLGAVNNDSSSFAVGNMMTNIQYYHIEDIFHKKFRPYRIEKLPQTLNGFRAIVYIGDSLIFGAPYRGNMHLFKFNNYTKSLETFREYTEKFPLMDPEMKREIFGCSMAVKPDNSKFVLAYSRLGKIEIFENNKSKPIVITYKGFPSLEENTGLNSTSKFIKKNPDELIFNEGIIATDKYIYACILNDKVSNVNNPNGPNRNFIREIHVFDWSGNPIIKIKLSKFYLYYSVALNDKYIYAIDDDVENIVYRYDLNKVLY